MKNSLITNLKKEIDSSILENINIYLFGSARFSNNYRDIDLLIIYDDNFIKIIEILNLRKFLTYKLGQIYLTKIDICLLSKQENEETSFIEDENGLKLI